MELHEPTLKGFWSEEDNETFGFFIINEAIISKLCILGEDVEPCFEGAQITRVQFSFDENFQNKLFSMMEQVKEINNKGGTDSVEEEKEVIEVEETLEEEVIESEEETPAEPEVEETPVEEVPIEEEVIEEESSEDENIKYNLDEIQEYIELKSDYENLQTQFNTMKAEYEELVEFKRAADRKEKQAMIDSFYMLTDEDKQDVITNIDKYSVDDIEAKLSVICVRNRVSFDLDEEKHEESTVFALNEDIDDDITPA